MNRDNSSAAGCGSAVGLLLVCLAIIAVVIGVAMLLSISTSGTDLAMRAKQSQIDREQAETAKALAEASKYEAEARAVERESQVATTERWTEYVLSVSCVAISIVLSTAAVAVLLVKVSAVRTGKEDSGDERH